MLTHIFQRPHFYTCVWIGRNFLEEIFRRHNAFPVLNPYLFVCHVIIFMANMFYMDGLQRTASFVRRIV